MCLSKPEAPKVVRAPAQPVAESETVLAARDDELRRRRRASGLQSTLLTGGSGATSVTGGMKTLLGQ